MSLFRSHSFAAFTGLPTWRWASLAGAFLLLLLTSACSPSPASQEELQGQVEEMLAAYLPALADYYRTGEPGAVAEMAAPKEVDRINRLILERAQNGRVIDPSLDSVAIEKLDVYQHSNALLTTQEVWDLRVRAAGSDRVIQEELDKPNRFRYQLKRGDSGQWRVLYREVVLQ